MKYLIFGLITLFILISPVSAASIFGGGGEDYDITGKATIDNLTVTGTVDVTGSFIVTGADIQGFTIDASQITGEIPVTQLDETIFRSDGNFLKSKIRGLKDINISSNAKIKRSKIKGLNTQLDNKANISDVHDYSAGDGLVLKNYVFSVSNVPWVSVSKTGSSLADLETKSAGALTSGNLDMARMPTGGTWNMSTTMDVQGTIQQSDAYFFAYDAAGGTLIPTSWADITWDTEVRKDALYGHPNDDAEITFNDDGWYLLTAECGDTVSDNTRSDADWRLVINTGSGYVEIPGSRAATYSRNHLNGNGSMSISRLIEISAGDVVKVQGQSNRPTQVSTLPNTCRLLIERE